MLYAFIHTIADLAVILPAFFIALSFHESAHALAATLLGDDTPKKMGRLTLNPLSHIDPMGILFLLVFRIGWAKPVMFDQRNFKHPRFYSILTAFAGPTSNFILAVVSFYIVKYIYLLPLSTTVSLTFSQIFRATAYVNIMLGVFNILPIPPLDGSHIFTVFLAKRFPGLIIWFYRYSMFLLIALFLFPPTRMMLIRLILVAEFLLKKLVY